MERPAHPSFLGQALDMHLGSPKSQLFVYGITFIVTLAVALVADLGLGQSETSVALFSVALVAALSFVVPVISVKLFGSKVHAVDAQEPYAKLREDITTLQKQVIELTDQVEAASQPYGITLSAAALANLDMLVSNSKSASIIHYIQDLVYKELTNFRLESIYVANEGPSPRTLMLPIDLKRLLEQAAKGYGFASVEEYLVSVINMQVRRLQEREEEESREVEKRRKVIVSDKLYVRPNIPRPMSESAIKRNESNFVEGNYRPLMGEHSSGSPAEI